jgi:tetratricopeptide (TPR) repeat protein
MRCWSRRYRVYSPIGYPEAVRTRPLVVRLLPAICVLTLAPAAKAQEAGDTWKELVTQGQHDAADNEYAKAEQSFLKAVHEAERFAADDWRVGTTLESLGQIYTAEKKYSEAESAFRRALEIATKASGDGSEEIADVTFDMAKLMYDAGRQRDALTWGRKAVSAYENTAGGTSVQTAAALCLLGDSLRSMKNFVDAEEPLRRCADIREKDGGIDNIELADALHSLALTYAGERKYAMAETRFKLVEKIRENKLGLTSPLLAQAMEDHAALLRVMGRSQEAERLELLSTAIRRNEKKNAH